MSRRTATINQIRAFLIEQGIAVRSGAHALRKSLFPILDQRRDEISERMYDIIIGLYEDWLWLDERIESISSEIDALSDREMHCRRLKSIPGLHKWLPANLSANKTKVCAYACPIKATAHEPTKQAGYISATSASQGVLTCEMRPVHTWDQTSALERAIGCGLSVGKPPRRHEIAPGGSYAPHFCRKPDGEVPKGGIKGIR